jgi:hypothetical protein
MRSIQQLIPVLALFIFLPFSPVHAQEKKDSWGSTQIKARFFAMNTVNEGPLRDYFASAIGLGAGYQSPDWKGISFKSSIWLTQGLYTTDIASPDPISGAFNRYEIGLFNVRDVNDRTLFRVEDLYFQYRNGASYLRAGRQLITTPFINPQDGRMNPSYVQGVYGRLQANKIWHVEGGWLNRMSPRGTEGWYTIGTSMGAYPQGLSSDGNRANYEGNVQSKGIGLLKAGLSPLEGLDLQFWNTFVENLLYVGLAQADAEIALSEKMLARAGIQMTYLSALKDGGNPDRSLTYLMPECESWVLSSRLGIGHDRADFSVNYTRMSGQGRFQFPREWGRDPFYTFMPRERNEGYGSVEALVLRSKYHLIPKRLQAELSHGWFQLPAANDVELNKYGLPSYHQTNLDIRYKANSSWSFQYLIVYKGANGNTFDNPRYIQNKVNMLYHNLVLNLSL